MKTSLLLVTLSLGLASLSSASTVAAAHNHQDSKMSHSQAMKPMTSTMFSGIEANTGNVIATVSKGSIMLKLSDDFKTPKSPAPHWQVLDSKGNVFLLKQIRIKGDAENRSVMLPSYIKDVKKVQIWCSFAEVNLGEAMFAKPIAAR